MPTDLSPADVATKARSAIHIWLDRDGLRPVLSAAFEAGGVPIERCMSWHAVMTQVRTRGEPMIDDPARLAGITTLGVDETSFLRATGTRNTTYATAIADLAFGCGLGGDRGRP